MNEVFDQSLSDSYAKLSKKQDELERLQSAGKKLLEIYDDFKSNDKLCKKPDLNSKTWFGNTADDFEQKRETEIQNTYNELKDQQLGQRIDTIAICIENTKNEIASLQTQITALKTVQQSKNA